MNVTIMESSRTWTPFKSIYWNMQPHKHKDMITTSWVTFGRPSILEPWTHTTRHWYFNSVIGSCKVNSRRAPKHNDHVFDIDIGRVSRSSPKGMPKTPWAQGGPRSNTRDLWRGGEKAQMILVWVRAPGIGNASHPRGLEGMRVKPWAICSPWHEDSRMLTNTSFGGVS